jgi:hypothetical protein
MFYSTMGFLDPFNWTRGFKMFPINASLFDQSIIINVEIRFNIYHCCSFMKYSYTIEIMKQIIRSPEVGHTDFVN